MLGAVPLLLAQESEDDMVQLGALDVALAVISRKDRLELPSAEADMIWALMGPILQVFLFQFSAVVCGMVVG